MTEKAAGHLPGRFVAAVAPKKRLNLKGPLNDKLLDAVASHFGS